MQPQSAPAGEPGALAIMERPTTLRVAVTDRCDLRCAYCMPPSGVTTVDRSELLSLERLAEIVGWIHHLSPLVKIKLTGGEPLLRRGIEELVRLLGRLEPHPELSLTTNGTQLAKHAAALAAAGLSRVTVSVDTVDADRFRALTRGGRITDVLAGLAAAKAAGLEPLKINSVLRRSSFRDDVPAVLDLAGELAARPRFLELMRTGTQHAWCEAEAVSADEVLHWLDGHPDCELIHGHDLGRHGAEPARNGRLRWRGAELEVGWILPLSAPFCDSCDRLRLDARGRVRRCLMDPVRLDLASVLDTEGPPAARIALARHLAGKRPPEAMITPLPMVQLGG